MLLKLRSFVVIPLGFEPRTHSLEGCCSIQLSYRTIPFCVCKDTKKYINGIKKIIFFNFLYPIHYQIVEH